MKRYVYAMSTTKSDVKRRLQDIGGELTEHLVKLILYPKAPCSNHWMSEIWAFLYWVPKLKQNNKLPSADFIFDNISICLDQVEGFVRIAIMDYPEFEVSGQSDISSIEIKVRDYFMWISSELAHSGVVSKTSVYNKLESLIG